VLNETDEPNKTRLRLENITDHKEPPPIAVLVVFLFFFESVVVWFLPDCGLLFNSGLVCFPSLKKRLKSLDKGTGQ